MKEINCLTIKKYGDIVQEKIKNTIWIRMKEAKELTDEDKEIKDIVYKVETVYYSDDMGEYCIETTY